MLVPFLRPFPGSEAHKLFSGAPNVAFWVGGQKVYVETFYVLFPSLKWKCKYQNEFKSNWCNASWVLRKGVSLSEKASQTGNEFQNNLCTRGPKDQKKNRDFDRDWKFRSRIKFSSEPPTAALFLVGKSRRRDQKFRARSKISIEIIFFWSVGPLGYAPSAPNCYNIFKLSAYKMGGSMRLFKLQFWSLFKLPFSISGKIRA